MGVVQGLILIAALVFLAIDHTRIIIENRRLWKYIEQEEATRSRNIYIKTKEEDDLIDHLVAVNMEAYDQVQATIVKRYWNHGCLFVEYDNGDQIIVAQYGARIGAFPQNSIGNYSHRIFFDYKLPDGAISAVIKDLGLTDYMIQIGICTERSGENGKKDE